MALICLLALLSLVLQPIYCTGKCQSCLQLCPLRHFTDLMFKVDPVSMNTTLNSIVNFTCEATAVDELTFRVNSKPSSDRMFRGFTRSTNGSYDLITGTLQVTAYDVNNNTNIRCRGSNDNKPASYSDTALLLIQGSECLF